MYYMYYINVYIYILIEHICGSPAIFNLAGWKPDWYFTKKRTVPKIVFKKSFNTKDRIWVLSKYSSVLFNFKKQAGSSYLISRLEINYIFQVFNFAI